jgi:hypothetical protein
MKPSHEGKTISVWRHRAFANHERLSKATDPDKIAALQATADTYATIIADLEARGAAQQALLPHALRVRPQRTHVIRAPTRSKTSSRLSAELGIATPCGVARRTDEGLWLACPTLPRGVDIKQLLVPSKRGSG